MTRTITLTARKLLLTVLSLQFAFLGLVALNKLGLEIPVLRQVIGFIYLTFIPGFFILKLLHINNKNTTELLLYSVGLSLSFLMFIGLLINSLYPLVYISNHPISESSLLVTINIIILSLCSIWYLHSRNYSKSLSIDANQIFSPLLVSPLLLPFLAVFGVYLLEYYDNNSSILIVLTIISAIPLFVALDKLPNKVYPFVIWGISAYLVLYNSLFGQYMRPTDNIYEYYLCNLVIKNEIWNSTIPNNINAMLGVIMLLPEFSKICNINLVWLYKIYVPLLSSLIPLGLYEIFIRRVDHKVAFLSSFFSTSFFVYFTWISITMKMVSAYLFLMLLILLMVDQGMDQAKKRLLGIIFAFSLITSHYGTSYIFLSSLVVALFFICLLRSHRSNELSFLLTPSYVMLYVVLTVSWYMYNSAGQPFRTFVTLGYHFVRSIFREIFPETYGTQLLFGNFPLYLEILRILYIISAFFILVGLLTTFFDQVRRKSIDEYIALSFPLLFFAAAPYIFGTIGTFAGGRLPYMASFLLAPFCITGFTKILNCIRIKKQKLITIIIGFFLCTFFLFNSNFTAEVIWKHNIGASVYLSEPRIAKEGTIEEKEYLDRVYLTSEDIYSAEWLANHMRNNSKVYCGKNAEQNLLFAGLTRGYTQNKIGSSNIFPLIDKIEERSYIYLTKFNINTWKIKQRGGAFPELFNITEIFGTDISNKIYTNSGSEIYYR